LEPTIKELKDKISCLQESLSDVQAMQMQFWSPDDQVFWDLVVCLCWFQIPLIWMLKEVEFYVPIAVVCCDNLCLIVSRHRISKSTWLVDTY
jgi:hypothetical protein